MRSGLHRMALNRALRAIEGGQSVAEVAAANNVRPEYLEQFVTPPKKKRRVKKVAAPHEGAAATGEQADDQAEE